MSSPGNPTPNRRKFLPVVALLGVAVLLLLWWLNRTPQPPSNILPVSGRLEADDSQISARVTGRVREITVREGDPVEAGQVLVVLDDDQIRAREGQAQSALQQSKARARASQHQVSVARQLVRQSQLAVGQAQLDSQGKVQQARQQVATADQQVGVLESQLAESKLSVDQARLEASGRVAQAEQQVAAAEAELVKAQAQASQAGTDSGRYAALLLRGSVSRQVAEQYQTQAATLQAVEQATRKQLEAAKGALQIARSSLANSAIRRTREAAIQQQIVQAQASASGARGNLTSIEASLSNPEGRRSQQEAARDQLAQAQADLDAAQGAVKQAEERLKEVQADRKDLKVLAPFAGMVATRVVEPGEVVTPGSNLITLIDLNRVYLRGFVPEGEIGKVKVGQAARCYLDSAPGEAVEAVVSRIDPQVSFTPQNTYFRNDRVKQVIGLKLQLKGKLGFAKPGMPADGDILLSGQWRNWR